MKVKMVIMALFFGTLLTCNNGGDNSSLSLASITVTPANPSLMLGKTQQFTATGTYADSSTKDLTSAATWTSSDAAVATISSVGLATSISEGSATVTATSGRVSGSTTLAVQNSSSESPFGFHPASVAKQGYYNNGFGDAANIGVTWTRDGVYAYWFLVQPDLADPAYDFTQYDRQWSRVPVGMNILANIAPQGPIDEGRCLPGSYFPVDEQKYVAFVKAVVRRYGGDSYAAAGLDAPIKYWQVGNEPNSQKRGFADLQRITYMAIKAVCPDCMVLIGGVPGMPPVSDYLANFDQHYKPILDVLGGKYVDVMDFHWYGNATGDYRGGKEAYDHIRSVLGAGGFHAMPFWITEMGAYSGDPISRDQMHFDYPFQSEQQQALDYFKRFVYPLSFGVKKIFPAFGLMEGFKYDGGYFDFTGLIYDGWDPAGTTPSDLGLGVKKLGYYTYKKMTEMLEGSDWGNIQTIQESENVYIFKFTKNNAPVYVAWWDYFNEPSFAPGNTKTISITGVQGNSALVTEAVPKFSAGKDVMDYATAFNTQIVSVSNGTVTLTLNENPVLVVALE
ncbi:MAG: Ig-like domain-containing protein [Acidobacteria bacterium]|nr:Ig-like domain-containing protein [Acidobacteriota bacterium]MBU4306304.1 Ig-like domain-containing protein [Acidobacteriota bacterium]MBU4404585.1 Ig-like domain-containing protein [Acidobacteriota bacterium]MCG2812370.1 Ig-like domain-containing protein [Candidatus Aminicenantes bacterium]